MKTVTSFNKFLTFLFLCFLTVGQVSQVEAGGWGRTEQVTEFEGAKWNSIYFDMNGLNFTAVLPNYSAASMVDGEVLFRGSIEPNFAYGVITGLNSNFQPPKTQKEFVKIIQDANPNTKVIAIDPKKFGALYVVDIIPSNKTDLSWRFFCSKDNLIKLGTSEENTKRIAYFFDNVRIIKK